jgi:MraZ protein
MSTFYGSETTVLDAKGRITVPARLRRGISPDANDMFVIVKGFDGCVNMFPHDEWSKYSEKVRALSSGDDTARAFVRQLMDTLHEAPMDPQGRVTLTDKLIRIAGVEREVKLLGAFDHIEIWNEKTFGQKVDGANSSFEEMARKLFS